MSGCGEEFNFLEGLGKRKNFFDFIRIKYYYSYFNVFIFDYTD
jgi:hypothetical protein